MPAAVSVIIPVHNRPELLQRAVLSVQRQRLPPAEIIVVDDCSTDRTPEVAAELGVRLLRHDRNRGAATARNTGVAAASGEWVALLDSDDEWLPNLLETLWEPRGGHVVVSGAALRCWEDAGRRHRYSGTLTKRPAVLDTPAPLVRENTLPNSTTLLHRASVLAVGGYNTSLRYAEDWDLLLRMLERGTALLVPEVVAIYHCHGSQKSRHSSGPAADHERILRSYADRPWYSGWVREERRGIVLWDQFSDGLIDRRWREALPAGARIPLHPARVSGVTRIWLRRSRIRRRSASIQRLGGHPYRHSPPRRDGQTLLP